MPSREDARVALAEIVVLDQFTRNTLRGQARAFAGDARALQVARGLFGALAQVGVAARDLARRGVDVADTCAMQQF